MSRVLFFAAIFCFGWTVHAQILVQDLRLRADQTFTLQAVVNGQATPIKGSLHDSNPASAKQGPITATVGQYTGYATVALVEDGHDMGALFIFEISNNNFTLKNQRPIAGRAASMNEDLKAILDELSQQNGWDVTQTLPAMMEYFRNAPDKTLSDFADQVELHRVKTLARPSTKLAPLQQPANVARGEVETQPVPPAASGGDDAQDDDQLVMPGDSAQDRPAPAPLPPVRRKTQQRPRYVAPPQPQPNMSPDFDDDSFYKPNRRLRNYFPPPPPPPAQYGNQVMIDPYTGQPIRRADPGMIERQRQYYQQPAPFPFNMFRN